MMGDRHNPRMRRRGQGGYLVVLFVIIVAFVGVLASMQVLVLTSVATTSRAYDSFRQGSIELPRIQRAVTESLFDQCQIGAPAATATLADALSARLLELAPAGSSISVVTVPDSLPAAITFPSSTASPDSFAAVPLDLQPYLTPELYTLLGPQVVAYPECRFAFTSARTVLGTAYTFPSEVRARLIAVPLTRFPIAAYELPVDIGTTPTAASPASAMPAGLVPTRDAAFVADLQGQSGVLPYHYRQRSVTAAAYQYVFSQAYIDRVAEYAGIAHFCDLAATTGTATLAGLTKAGTIATWDLGHAGSGTYGTITTASDAAVVFTESAGYDLRLVDSVGDSTGSPLFLLVLGPANASVGALALDLSSLARPVVIVGYNVRVTAGTAVAVNGALFLDPASTLAASTPVTLGHLSYWAGATAVDAADVNATGVMTAAAQALAPRVLYVATRAARL